MSSFRFGKRNANKQIWNGSGLALFFVALFSAPVTLAACQDVAKKPEVERQELASAEPVTVTGQFVGPQNQLNGFELSELKASLEQLIEFQQPEMPANWQAMTVEQRKTWITNFEASDEGKAIISANQALEDGQVVIDLKIDSDGKFVVYDVPGGQFQLKALAETERDGTTYIIQAFGLITVSDVDEVQLGTMPLEVLRDLKMQELAPEISGKTFSGEQASLSVLHGKHVLINFAALANPAFEVSIDAIKEMSVNPELAEKLSVLTISVDEDAEAAKKIIAEKSIDWPCIALGGWNTSVLNSYGVKSIPSFWLLDPDGQIVLTGQQSLIELRRTGSPLPVLIDDVIAGRIVIGADAEDTGEDGAGNDDKDK